MLASIVSIIAKLLLMVYSYETAIILEYLLRLCAFVNTGKRTKQVRLAGLKKLMGQIWPPGCSLPIPIGNTSLTGRFLASETQTDLMMIKSFCNILNPVHPVDGFLVKMSLLYC